jgi:hypothetical protein
MKKFDNHSVFLFLLGISLLTFNFLCKNQDKDEISWRNEVSIQDPTSKPAESDKTVPRVNNPFAVQQPVLTDGIQSYEPVEEDASDIKFGMGIIL